MNIQKAMLAKATSVLSYDQNKKVIYTPSNIFSNIELWKKDERK